MWVAWRVQLRFPMKLRTALRIVLLSTAPAIFGCSASATEEADQGLSAQRVSEKRVQATTAAHLARLGSIVSIQKGVTSGGEHVTDVDVRLFHTVREGDGERNGDHLVLALADAYGGVDVFELGLDVASVEEIVGLPGNELKIVGTTDVLDGEGNLDSSPFAVTITYDLETHPRAITVEQDGASRRIERSADPAVAYFGDVLDMHADMTTATGPLGALFTVVAGDVPRNGSRLVVSLKNGRHERTYDLGVDVASVRSMHMRNPGKMAIEAEEDVLDEDGMVFTRPRAYELAFSIDEDGAPARVVRLAKTR